MTKYPAMATRSVAPDHALVAYTVDKSRHAVAVQGLGLSLFDAVARLHQARLAVPDNHPPTTAISSAT